MKRKIKFIASMLVLSLALSAAAPAFTGYEVNAGVKKVKGNKNYKKSKAVKKGVTKVSCAKANKARGYYVKFKAPSKGTYNFEFSNFSDGVKTFNSENDFGLALFSVYGKNGIVKKIKTGSGTDRFTDMIISGRLQRFLKANAGTGVMKELNDYMKSQMGKKIGTKTYARLKLKKGEVVYILSATGNTRGYSYNLKISKK